VKGQTDRKTSDTSETWVPSKKYQSSREAAYPYRNLLEFCATVIAFLSMQAGGQRLTTTGATESLIRLFQPLINVPSLDSNQVGSQINTFSQAILRELLEFLTIVSIEVRTFITELQPLRIQATNDLAATTPTPGSQSLTAFTTHFLWSDLEMICDSLAIFAPISIGSIYPTCPTEDSASSHKNRVNHRGTPFTRLCWL